MYFARKRSLGQGNVFTPAFHSVQGGAYEVTSCFWSHDLSGGVSVWHHVHFGGFCKERGFCQEKVGGGSLSGGGFMSSYWNAVFLSFISTFFTDTAIRLVTC